MKRLIVSVVLLALVSGICITTFSVQRTGTDELLLLLEDMDQAYRAQEMETCRRLSDRFAELVEEKAAVFSLFLPHKDLADIQELAVMLPVILRQKDSSHYSAELEKCRFLLERLERLEHPILQNIL